MVVKISRKESKSWYLDINFLYILNMCITTNLNIFLRSDDGRIEMKLTNNSCLVNITASNAKDNGTWSFYTREMDDSLISYDYHTTYPVVVKSKYS